MRLLPVLTTRDPDRVTCARCCEGVAHLQGRGWGPIPMDDAARLARIAQRAASAHAAQRAALPVYRDASYASWSGGFALAA